MLQSKARRADPSLRREVLEQRVPDLDEVLEGLNGVTAEDARVAQDIVADEKLRLAVIGPFDDAERFEKLLQADICWRLSPPRCLLVGS